jgi:hypothetical protein
LILAWGDLINEIQRVNANIHKASKEAVEIYSGSREEH